MIVPKGLEQALQDHRVGDVKHLKFVHTEDSQVFAERIANSCDGIGSFLILKPLIEVMLLLMNFEHELIVVKLSFANGWIKVVIELIHNEGLPTAWVTPKVNALEFSNVLIFVGREKFL